MADQNGASGAETLIAEKEARRAERKAATAAARAEQYAKDLEQVDKLEEQHGDDRVGVLTMPSFREGLPTVVVVGTPEPLVYKRFRQQITMASDNLQKRADAMHLLGESCLLYPDKETYAKMREAWPAIHDGVAVEAVRLGQQVGKT